MEGLFQSDVMSWAAIGISIILPSLIGIYVHHSNSKFQHSLDARLETYKSSLERTNYITKTEFNYEFGLYVELQSTLVDCFSAIEWLFPDGLIYTQPEPQILLKDAEDNLKKLTELIHKSRPFLNENVVNSYFEYLAMCKKQLSSYRHIYIMKMDLPVKEMECYNTTSTIRSKYNSLSEELGIYLSELKRREIIE
ncbi:hypothetical protein O0S10_07235 [Methanocorpusculum sp. MG]|uniref:DUF4760 domain-containing protein n=1 Tax=Methanocorpusculum petauri TaxID=3002863 RepID=A0ABT4IIV3_9EURY|nr:hypothetical protein [Methanocorpusculum petauri]MCZ0861018.1 hypothetical protein [Methanocorpusculum petauri]